MDKIFIGLTNIASQIPIFANGFSKLGYETITAIEFNHGNLENNDEIDYRLDESRKINFRFIRPKYFQENLNFKFGKKGSLFKKAVKECNIFLFLWNTFHNYHIDLRILRNLNKKIIIFFVGDDIRWYYSMKQEFSKYNMEPIMYSDNLNLNLKMLNRRLSFLRFSEKYADLILSAPNQSQLSLRPYKLAFVPIDIENYDFNNFQREKNPLIIHAPSVRNVKGTKFIIETINRLKNDGISFNFKLIENVKNKEALDFYKDADIIIDQLLIPGGGKLAKEGMALGKVVMSLMGTKKGYLQGEVNNSPIIDVDKNNLYSELKRIIEDPGFRKILSMQGRQYVEKYHCAQNVCSDMLNYINLNKYDDSFIFPHFFRNEFVPESIKSLKVYNKWNNFVKECDWYKNYVRAGERDGLNF